MAFTKPVHDGKIIKSERIIKTQRRDAQELRYVCYTLPDQEWRAQTYFWIREQMHTGLIQNDAHCDIMCGRLLGYSEADVHYFVRR